MEKAYNRIGWRNSPSVSSPLDEINLNRMDNALNTIDNRVVEFDTTKANQSDLLNTVSDVSYDQSTGTFTVTWRNGRRLPIDTDLEKVAVNFDFNEENQQIVIYLPDGSTKDIDLSAFVTQYNFNDTARIRFSTSNGQVSADLIPGTITDQYLQPSYLADITAQASIATNAAADAYDYKEAAESSKDDAASSALSASQSASNASQSAEAAASSESTVTTAAQQAVDSAQAAATSETNAATSEANAAASALSASNDATDIRSNIQTATTAATQAASSANSASASASSASNSASLAATSETNAAASARTAASAQESVAQNATLAANSATQAAASSTAATQAAAQISADAAYIRSHINDCDEAAETAVAAAQSATQSASIATNKASDASNSASAAAQSAAEAQEAATRVKNIPDELSFDNTTKKLSMLSNDILVDDVVINIISVEADDDEEMMIFS